VGDTVQMLWSDSSRGPGVPSFHWNLSSLGPYNNDKSFNAGDVYQVAEIRGEWFCPSGWHSMWVPLCFAKRA
jgi:hypothetical protein